MNREKRVNMKNHEERIKELEQKEQILMARSVQEAQADGVSPSLHSELLSIRSKLKVARRVRSMNVSRIKPKLTRKVSFLLPEDEYEALLQKADGKELSKYIRDLLKRNT